MKKHVVLSYLILFSLLSVCAFSVLIYDTSPDENSYQIAYGGQPTTTLHKFSAHLSNKTENIFWFVQITDVHIGAYLLLADNKQNFRDFCDNVRHILRINNDSNFIVSTGDLINGQLPLPVGQDINQWRAYHDIAYEGGLSNTSYYYDLVGNHDGYGNSLTFSYYLNWSIQKQLQYSWNRTFPFGNYTFIALNTVQHTGSPFPDGTSGSLNRTELNWFEQKLITAAKTSNLTFVFGHHPENDVGNSTTSSGLTFLQLLEKYNASAYIFGHGHENHERNQGGTLCIESDSLGQPSTAPGYRIVAVDNDGISTIYQPLNAWPAVLITCPIDRGLTMQAPDIPNNSQIVPIRALVFDENAVSEVQFKLDNGSFKLMSPSPNNSKLWNASFDASVLAEGEHTITVQASSPSGIASDSISVRVGSPDTPDIVNGPLPNFYRTKNSAPWHLNLSMYEWDRIDVGSQLNWSINGGNSSLCSIYFDSLRDYALFTPVQDAVGSHIVTFTLKNSRDEVTSQTILITLVDRLDPNEFQLYLGIIIVISVIGVIILDYFVRRRI